MSHGGGSDDNAEPDLTAMLDLVMQLLLYFIMCANFIDQENTPDVVLPVAQTAKPIIGDTNSDVLFLNVDQEGKVLILGEAPKDMDATRLWLDNRALDAKAKSGNDPIRTAIVVRAHQDASYDNVYQLMQACKQKGFKRFKLRAVIAGGGQ
jgi:biopolymer transport protein ExbD